jgi:tetratricopeptide (TPR) repeat protein
LPLSAQLIYIEAVTEAGKGNYDQAVVYLEQALELDPAFADAYFTLSRIKFRQFDPDALFYLVQGIQTASKRFSTQSLLAVNGLLIATMLLVILVTVASISFAVRYLPFPAHKVAEFLKNRFNAAAPGTTAIFLLLLPFALLPGFVSGVCLLIVMTWYFMSRREKMLMAALLVPFVLLGIFSPKIKQFNPLADPGSFTHLAAKAMYSPGNTALITAVERMDVPGLEAEQHNVLGLLHYRQENHDSAAAHFLRAIELKPDAVMAYINLGNVYFSQAMYEKALEGYRKAAQVDDSDAAGQYNLAQAYIKSLLMAESSKALRKAASGGIDDLKKSYAVAAQPHIQVFPKTFSNAELWQMARVEGLGHENDFISEILQPLFRTSAPTGAWFFIGTLLFVILLGGALRKKNLTFQCSNCGELTCDTCCTETGSTYLCRPCASVVDGVSSDKVIEALLRQRRQGVLVRRRKGIRLFTLWLPGMRDFYYGRIARGTILTVIFALSAIQLWSRGLIVNDWNSLVIPEGWWRWVIPLAGITIAYLYSILTKRYLEVRNYRSSSKGSTRKDGIKENAVLTRSASA